ncbi:MAG: ABC transporter substrate-binding protein [Pirellulaceae bacterium]|nr:ABC transporter substrate-binding protein [Pirellulaceae bacterium]
MLAGFVIRWLCPGMLAVLIGIAALAGSALAQAPAPLAQRIIDRPPFDRITLDKQNENKVLIVRPLPLPGRRVSEKPKPSDKLRIQMLDEAQEYEVLWQHIEKVELFEQLVLAEAAGLAAQGKFDEAYEYFVFMFASYPNAIGLKEAQQSYLYLSSGAAFRAGKHDEALAIVEELLAQNPTYRAGPTAPTLLQVLGNIADRRLAGYVQQEDYRSARALLVRLARQYNAAGEPFAQKWQMQLSQQAAQLRDEARAHLAAKRFVEARDACARMELIWPTVEGGSELVAEVARRYPLVAVGVEHPALEFDARSLVNPAARRAGRLVERRLLEFSAPGPEGGKYQCPLGTVEQSVDGREISFSLTAAARGGELSGYELAERLLAWSRPGDADFQPAWARALASVAVADVQRVIANLKTPRVLAESLLQLSYQLAANVGQPGAKGNGPFFVLSTDDAQTRFTANDRYFLAQPGQPAEISEHHYPDPQRALVALARGEIDVLDRVFPGDIAAVAANSELAVAPLAMPTTHVLAFAEHHPQLSNRQFRRALAYASNRELILNQGVLKGKPLPGFRVVSAPFPAPTGGDAAAYAYDQQIPPRPYDPRLAVAMKAIGLNEIKAMHDKQMKPVPPLAPLTLGHPADETSRIACRALVKQWKVIGIECKLVEFPPGIFLDEQQICDIVYYQISAHEPLVDAARLLGPQGIAPTSNGFVQLALRQIDKATNWQDARVRFQQLHRLLHEDVTLLPLFQTFDHYAYRKSLQGPAAERVTLYQNVEAWQISPRLARGMP